MDRQLVKVLLVGGTFKDKYRRGSGWIEKFGKELKKEFPNTDIYNGGCFTALKAILETTKYYDIIFWLVDVDNLKEKIRDVKAISPKCMLITSKRNDNNKYEFKTLINRALLSKSNLVMEFQKENGIIKTRVFDPLGTVWCDFTEDIGEVTKKLIERLMFIINITRQNSIKVEEEIPISDIRDTIPDEFLEIVRNSAKKFHNLINPDDEVHRFLGNCSFRCMDGFPSIRLGRYILVSKRNINKEDIEINNFVVTYLKDDKVYYFGEDKPSVDTPIQLRLFNILPEINYIIHSHVYIEGAEFTRQAIPCGALEEIEEIKILLKKLATRQGNLYTINGDGLSINLIGHGSLVLAKSLNYFSTVKFYSRDVPEII